MSIYKRYNTQRESIKRGIGLSNYKKNLSNDSLFDDITDRYILSRKETRDSMLTDLMKRLDSEVQKETINVVYHICNVL